MLLGVRFFFECQSVSVIIQFNTFYKAYRKSTSKFCLESEMFKYYHHVKKLEHLKMYDSNRIILCVYIIYNV